MMSRNSGRIDSTVPEVAVELARWLEHLGAERRMSG
jgi:hypothetical protein